MGDYAILIMMIHSIIVVIASTATVRICLLDLDERIDETYIAERKYWFNSLLHDSDSNASKMIPHSTESDMDLVKYVCDNIPKRVFAVIFLGFIVGESIYFTDKYVLEYDLGFMISHALVWTMALIVAHAWSAKCFWKGYSRLVKARVGTYSYGLKNEHMENQSKNLRKSTIGMLSDIVGYLYTDIKAIKVFSKKRLWKNLLLVNLQHFVALVVVLTFWISLYIGQHIAAILIVILTGMSAVYILIIKRRQE